MCYGFVLFSIVRSLVIVLSPVYKRNDTHNKSDTVRTYVRYVLTLGFDKPLVAN